MFNSNALYSHQGPVLVLYNYNYAVARTQTQINIDFVCDARCIKKCIKKAIDLNARVAVVQDC